MFTSKTTKHLVTAAMLLSFGGTMLSVPTASAALLHLTVSPVDDDVEPATASWIADIKLPDGARRATNSGDMAKFNKVLQEAAHANGGTIARSEMLVWTSEAAKSVIGDVSARMKERGYTVAEVSSVDSEAGRVTPFAAMHGDKSDSVVGLWIVTKTGEALLVWGRFTPDTTPAPVSAPAKAAEQTKAVAPKKATAAPKKVAVTKPKKSTVAASKTGRTETAAQRRARAIKAYQDYQYVKMMGPISGPMYRSTKW